MNKVKGLFALLFIGYGLLAVQASELINLHRYTSIKAWEVNAYWIETENSIVLIDTQLLRSDAKKLVAAIQSTGKPLQAVFITHPHPDHFSGLATLQDAFEPFPIYTSQATANAMADSLEKFFSSGFANMFGKDAERRFVAATYSLKNQQSINIDGFTFLLDDLGAGEATNNIAIFVPQKNWLFTGDATLHHKHYYLGEGRSAAVLRQLDYLAGRYNDAVFFSGHGEPASAELISQQSGYVVMLRKLVSEALSQNVNAEKNIQRLNSETRQEIALKVNQQFPFLGSYGFDPVQIISMSVTGVESELLNANHKNSPNAKIEIVGE